MLESLFALWLIVGPPGPQANLPEARPEITRAELESHVRVLASDENEGRALFSPGNRRAADYLARALAAAGVEPAGADGGWYQVLPLRRLEYPSVPRLLWKDANGQTHEARYGVDFDVELRGRGRSTAMLPVRIFYEFTANRLPGQGDPEMAIYFGVPASDREALLERYKVANFEDWGLEVAVVQGDSGYAEGKAKEDPPRPVTFEGGAEACERVELRGELRRQLERGKLTHVQLLVEEVETEASERNVVGFLRGSGAPEAGQEAPEAVLLSAHYDHIGRRVARRRAAREGAESDEICNGADDNASGCAALLELAGALARNPAPARTLVFLFTTGEEEGGYGIRYYVDHPVVPLERTVAHLNLEMLGRPDEAAGGPGRVWLSGPERSNLLSLWNEAGLEVAPDPHPEQRFFLRSDNYTVALRGVVAQTLSSYDLHKDYHRPSDEADRLDYGHLLTATETILAAVGPLAAGTLRPVWLEGMRPLPLEERLQQGRLRGGRVAPPPGNGAGSGARDEGERGAEEDER